MFVRVVDTALGAPFLVVNALSRFRKKLRPATAPESEENRLMAEWIEARRKRFVLMAELEKPTVSRTYATQLTLWEAAKAAKDKCRNLVLAMRANRKEKSNDKIPAFDPNCPAPTSFGKTAAASSAAPAPVVFQNSQK